MTVGRSSSDANGAVRYIYSYSGRCEENVQAERVVRSASFTPPLSFQGAIPRGFVLQGTPVLRGCHPYISCCSISNTTCIRVSFHVLICRISDVHSDLLLSDKRSRCTVSCFEHPFDVYPARIIEMTKKVLQQRQLIHR